VRDRLTEILSPEDRREIDLGFSLFFDLFSSLGACNFAFLGFSGLLVLQISFTLPLILLGLRGRGGRDCVSGLPGLRGGSFLLSRTG